MNYQGFDNMISRFMTLLYKRFLTFYSIQFIPSLFRTRTFFRCSTFLTHVIITFMLYALSVHWAYCSAVVSFMFLTAGTEDLDLSKIVGSVRATLRLLLVGSCMHTWHLIGCLLWSSSYQCMSGADVWFRPLLYYFLCIYFLMPLLCFDETPWLV